MQSGERGWNCTPCTDTAGPSAPWRASSASAATPFAVSWRVHCRGHYARRAVHTALTEAQQAHVARRVEVCPAIRGTIVCAELRARYGYTASYPAFIRHLRQLRPPLIQFSAMRCFASGNYRLKAWRVFPYQSVM